MKKKLITLAVASTLTAAVAVSAPAFADTSNVTIYGVANVSYELVNVGSNTAGTAGYSANKVSSNQSRLGLKGSEDLGDGLSAVWQIEQLIAIDNSGAGGNGLATRNTFAGLSSASAGTVLLGRHDTPYKLATRGMDVFADTIADNRSLMGGAGLTSNATDVVIVNTVIAAGGAVALGAATVAAVDNALAGYSAGAGFDGRQPEVVAYVSPAMGGFTGIIAYVAGAEGITASTQSKGSAWSLAGLYGDGPLTANIAYEVHDLGGAPGALGPIPAANNQGLKESAWKLAVGYKMDAFTVNAVYEKTSDNLGNLVNALYTAGAVPAGADILGHRSIYLSGKYSFGNDAVKLAYINMGDRDMAGTGANTGATQWALGYDHNMSKRTTLYALYTRLNNDTNSSFGLSSTSTGGGTTTQNGAGASPSAFSFGMTHTF